jgi:hypothetical protein
MLAKYDFYILHCLGVFSIQKLFKFSKCDLDIISSKLAN